MNLNIIKSKTNEYKNAYDKTLKTTSVLLALNSL